MVNHPNAYEGNAPYIFISYAHKNTDRVLPIIAALQSRGFRVWYDAGIEAGSEWPEYIAQHLKNCGCFVAFITEEALESQNCRREINYAISKNLPMLAVYLEEVSLTPGMEMQLGTLQALFAYRHTNMSSFLDTLCSAMYLRSCRDILFQSAEPTYNEPIIRSTQKTPVFDPDAEYEDTLVRSSPVVSKPFGTGIVSAPSDDVKEAPLDIHFCDAVELALDFGAISTSLISRRLGLGYNRAAKLLGQLEQQGIIESYQGPKPRETLITRTQWEEMKKSGKFSPNN